MPDGSAGIGPADAIAAPDPPVDEDRLHVVFGTGQVGKALAAHLARLGLTVRAVPRHQPPALDGGVEWRPADITDPEAARDAVKGASVICQCLNAPYTKWPALFPPLQPVES
jgi:nucleoside-diphosphate-sugar epimerase